VRSNPARVKGEKKFLGERAFLKLYKYMYVPIACKKLNLETDLIKGLRVLGGPLFQLRLHIFSSIPDSLQNNSLQISVALFSFFFCMTRNSKMELGEGKRLNASSVATFLAGKRG
jgi:hypothetical protein